ncbi:unnamed protein product [Clonostachys solani]|uniref:Rhodopsin domain-containing protein n=1 Tax=Clonostachys solani TaxID=160281 RepID=A0A9N9Z0J0_9HYPO|nr:unnamed protein product [Clonostachys solani]
MADISSMTPEQYLEYINGPAAMPPDGEMPDFTRIDNENGIATFVLIFNITIPTIFTLFYAYARVFVYKDFVHSDVYFFFSYALFICFCAFAFKIMHSFGFHVNQWDFMVKEMPLFMADTFTSTIFYILGAMFCKIAILLQWTRIFTPRGTRTDRKRKVMFWLSMFAIFFNLAYHLVAVLTVIIPCAPFYGNDERGAQLFTCVPEIYFDFIEACLNVALGFLIMAIPQQVIWSLQMPFREKLGISILFFIGVGAIGVAIARVVVCVQWFRDRGIFGDADPTTVNSTYGMADQLYIITVEQALHILIYTLPATPKAMKSLGVTRVFSSIGSSFSTLVPLLSKSRDTLSSSNKRSDKHLKLSGSEADEAVLMSLESYPASTRIDSSHGRDVKGKPSMNSVRTDWSKRSGEPPRTMARP